MHSGKKGSSAVIGCAASLARISFASKDAYDKTECPIRLWFGWK